MYATTVLKFGREKGAWIFITFCHRHHDLNEFVFQVHMLFTCYKV